MTEIKLRNTNEHIETQKTYLDKADFKKLEMESNNDETEVI